MGNSINTGRPEGRDQFVAGFDTRTPPPLPSDPVRSAGFQSEIAPGLATASSLDGSKRSHRVVALVALIPMTAMIAGEVWQIFG